MSENNQPIIKEEDAGQAPTIHSIREYMEKNGIRPRNGCAPIVAKVSDKAGRVVTHKPDQTPKVVVVSRVHHRDVDGKVKFVTSRFARELTSVEDCVIRRVVVGEEWVKVDTAWVSPAGYMFIENQGGKPYQVIPTPEQMEEARSRIIELGYVAVPIPVLPEGRSPPRTQWDKPREILPITMTPRIEPMWEIVPGESMQGKPTPGRDIYMRCRNGQVTVNIMALPV